MPVDRDVQGNRGQNDLLLNSRQFVFVQDTTDGTISVYNGPMRTTLSDTKNRPVIWDQAEKAFKECPIERAIQSFADADQGSYVVLDNPADVTNRDQEHPRPAATSNMPNLRNGKQINVLGPTSFALYPGQSAVVIQGHRLRTNEFLRVRVRDEEEARRNWSQAVISPQTLTDTGTSKTDGAKDDGKGKAEGVKEDAKTDPATAKPTEAPIAPATGTENTGANLIMGQELIIKGTEVAFYMPPTGIEVIQNEDGSYVCKAVSLERLEYCILLGEDGEKRYVIGPDVVFPEPTETFVEKDGTCKFSAIELNENMGIYVKVIESYQDEGEPAKKAGEELFITGKEQKIYYPRREHGFVKYGGKIIIYAIAIPAGESRYVLNRNTGVVRVVQGPIMFLPDPREEVITRRRLDAKTVKLLFTGNAEALAYNLGLEQADEQTDVGLDEERELSMSRNLSASGGRPRAALASRGEERTHRVIGGETFERGTTYTPPRTITLGSKYEGAVQINVWPGYAVQVVSRSGARKQVVGPQVINLEYDETLEVLRLSTSKPKTTDVLYETAYLQVQNNKVGDIISGETSDLVKVEVKVSYRVNFDGEPAKWFIVENYIKLLCDHARSKIRNAIKRVGIEQFNRSAIDIIRDTILGVSPAPGEKRPGLPFEENGMHVYDVEVLDVVIGDKNIAQLLMGAQHEAVKSALSVSAAQQSLATTQAIEAVNQQIAAAKAATVITQADLDQKQLEARAKLEQDKVRTQAELELADIANGMKAAVKKLESDLAVSAKKLEARKAEQASLGEISTAELARQKAKADQDLAEKNAELKLTLEKLQAEVAGVVARAQAFGPDVVAALQAFSDKTFAAQAIESMAPLAALEGKETSELLKMFFGGTFLAKLVDGNLPAIVGRSNREQGVVAPRE